uniref:Reverse transcriptase domain-containing protein n=1 Tax=Tanacetum cinerariifolium TaxID=118510 RepID=A0A6L2LQ55_TANCI|nr:reverse transcriptase domain-containing protein [Tanacetum cinerariifolium]
MRTRSSSNLVGESSPNPTTSNPKHRNRRRSKQPFSLEESPLDTMADQRTMAELLRAPTEGYAEVIVVPPILAENFELKHSLINMMTSDQFFRLEKTILMITSVARRWLEKEPPHSILTWEDLVSKFINEFFPSSRTTNLRNEISNFQQRFDESFHEAWDRYKDLLRACPHHGFTELHQLDTFYNALNPSDQDSLNYAAGGNLLERRTQDVLTIIKNKSKCLAADGNTFLEFQDNIQGYVSAVAVNYNQGNSGYRPPTVANQIRPPGFAQPNVQNNQNRFSQPQGYNRGNNFNQDISYQAPIQQNQVVPLTLMSNHTNELKNMMASFFQMNTASTLGSGPLPSNTIPNPKGELKAIATRSGLVLDGPFVPMPPTFINPEEDERAEETLTDPKLAEYTVKYQKMLKALLSNKEKLLELANTPLNENCSAVILKKLPEKLRDPRKFLIPYGFSKLKCKALVDLGASINLMPLLFWKKLGLPELISTCMTLELTNREICTPVGNAKDVFVLVVKFTFPADFVIVYYESDPRVPVILRRPFLQTTRALIDVHKEEMILRDGDERLTLNMRHDTSSYSNQPHKESINMINIYNDSYEYYLEDLFATNHLSGNPTFSSHTDLTSPEVINPLSGNTTSSSLDHLLEEFAEMDSVLEDLVDECNLVDPNNNLVDTILEMFIDEHTLDYSSPPLYDDVDDDLVELESDNDDPFDS